MDISYGVAAQQALFQQNVTVSMMKQASEMQQAMVSMLDQTAQNVPTGSRGGNVNISA